jgi:hypothetical protein
MKDICIILIDDKTKVKQPAKYLSINNQQYFLASESLQKEISEFGIDAGINNYSNLELVPSNVGANLVVFLSTWSYIKSDFLTTCISLNNIFRDAGVFCGPVYNNSQSVLSNQAYSKYLKCYHQYELDFGGNEISNITGERFNYPNILGCVFTGRAFNEFRYSPVVSSRHIDVNNNIFLNQIAQKYSIYYAKCLDKAVALSKESFSIEELSDYYYKLGYQDGLSLLDKSIKDKHNELWSRFIESPELFDNEMPRWLFDSSPEESGDYIESLVLLKCKYQIGFYEGMLGKTLI